MKLLLFLIATAFAKEGFRTDFASAPAAVQKWEERTFLVSSGDRPLGTAFLVHKDEKGLHFLTASHVALRCHGEGRCSLHRRAVWRRPPGDMIVRSELSVDVPEKSIHFFVPKGKSWERTGAAATDLAYMRTVDFPGSPQADFSEMGPFSLPTFPAEVKIERAHYILGYPSLHQRPSLRQSEEAKSLKIRWSEGESFIKRRYVSAGFMEPTMITRRFELKSNADSLGGNSGGPVVDESGKLLGLLYGGPAYDEYRDYEDFYSWIVPADYARVFLKAVFIGHSAAEAMCSRGGHKDRNYCK